MTERRKLVLIVDGDEAVRDALQFALRMEGLCVHAHSGGPGLLADPALMRAACVILDHRMPRTDGFALLSILRSRSFSPPAIMLIGRATPALRERAAAAGVRGVLEKPLLDNVLIDNVRFVLGAGGRLSGT